MSDDLQKRFAEQIEQQIEARWHECTLGAWMADHHDRVEELLSKGPIDWMSAAAAFGSEGLRVPGGMIPDAKSAEETWRRVSGLRARPAGQAGKSK